jgi:hypothetical protein
MFSRWILTNITSARGTLRCHKTRIPCWDQLVICGPYMQRSSVPMISPSYIGWPSTRAWRHRPAAFYISASVRDVTGLPELPSK